MDHKKYGQSFSNQNIELSQWLGQDQSLMTKTTHLRLRPRPTLQKYMHVSGTTQVSCA